MIDVVSAVILDKYNRLLVQKRGYNKEYGELWETPGGKVDPGEDMWDALRRELKEELNLYDVTLGGDIMTIFFTTPFVKTPYYVHFIKTEITSVPEIVEDQLAMDYRWLHALNEEEMVPSLKMLKTYLELTRYSINKK